MRARDKRFLCMAEEEALKSEMRYKIGAVLVDDKRVVNKGYNRWTGFNVEKQFFFGKGSIHAEADVLKNYLWYDGNLTLYVARKKFRNAKPCPHCLNLLKQSNVKRIVYTDGDISGEIYL